MALELYRAGECLEYAGPEPRQPVLEISVSEPVTGQQEGLTLPIDTGFAGYILLTGALYEKFGTAELPREQFGVYRTMAGPVVLRRAKVYLRLRGRRVESYVETPVHGAGKLLVGRRVLQLLDLALLGIKNQCCQLHRFRR